MATSTTDTKTTRQRVPAAERRQMAQAGASAAATGGSPALVEVA